MHIQYIYTHHTHKHTHTQALVQLDMWRAAGQHVRIRQLTLFFLYFFFQAWRAAGTDARSIRAASNAGGADSSSVAGATSTRRV
jgi:hypothetical protein